MVSSGKKLEPEFILPVGQPCLDGAVSKEYLFVLTDVSVLKYDKNSRRALGKIDLPIDKEAMDSRPLGILLYEGKIIVSCRDGRIFMLSESGQIGKEARLGTSPGFCKPVIFKNMLVAISCGAAESERFIFLSLPDLLPLRKHPATLQKISPLEDVERKNLGIPLVMEVMGCFLYCSFESGQILELNENLTVSRGVQFGRKCQLLTARICLENQKKVIFIGEADGKISKEGEGAKERTWDLIKVSAGCMETRADGKLLAVGFVTGQVALLTCKSLKPLSVLTTHKKNIHRIIWDGLKFFVFAADCLVSCYKPFNH